MVTLEGEEEKSRGDRDSRASSGQEWQPEYKKAIAARTGCATGQFVLVGPRERLPARAPIHARSVKRIRKAGTRMVHSAM
jgi:hypothetical protein